MEILGAVASTVTVVQTVKSLGRLTVELHRLFRDAPEELAACRIHIRIIQAEANLLHKLSSTGNVDQVTIPEDPNITSALTAAHEAVSFVAHECARFSTTTSIRKRSQWAVIDRSVTENILRRLQHAETSLGIVLQLQYR